MKLFYACSIAVLVPVAANALTVNGTIQHPTCGAANGCVYAWATGGTPPYSYMWTPVPASGQGTPTVCGLLPGTWNVTVTDAMAEEASMDFVLVDQASFGDVSDVLTYVYDGTPAHHPCLGQEGSFRVMVSMLGGTPPYTVTANGMSPIGYDLSTNDPYFGYFSQGEQVSVSVTDGTGCSGSGSIWIDGINTTPFSAENINPTCGGLNNGSVELYVGWSGPYGPILSIIDPGGGVIYSGDPMVSVLPLTDLAPGTYTVVRTYSPLYIAAFCEFTEQFTIPDLGVDCGTVSGTLFIDNDQDCVDDALEVGVPYRIIEITPGPQYAITNAYGHYSRWLVNGSYQLIPQGTGTDLIPICPPVQPVPFGINSDAVIIDIADSSNVQLDVRVHATANAARPGFAHTIWGDVRNLTAQVSGPITLTATFDPVMVLSSAAPTPSSVVANTITWELPSLTAYAHYDFAVYMQVPPDVGLIGQPFQHTFSVSQPLPESDLTNNAQVFNGTITGAYDPNDKLARTSSGYSDTQYFIGNDEYLDYTIRFQNTGTDTAFTVVVTDTITDMLDLSSFEQGVASHPFDVSFKTGSVVEWRFEDILLPDSNVNETASHGLVSFRIKPHLPLLAGTVIANTANIFFDFNPPVITEPSVLVAEFSTGMRVHTQRDLQAVPNPVNAILSVTAPAGMVELELLAMDGRSVRVLRQQGSNATLDLAGLRSGPYTLRVRLNDGTIMNQRIIKY